MADEIQEREDEGVSTFARNGVGHLDQRKYRRTDDPFSDARTGISRPKVLSDDTSGITF